MKTWPHFFHNNDTPPAQPGAWSWQTVAEMQQELWRRWFEASRHWLAWWTPELPHMPWPPAGQVAPPRDQAPTVMPTPVAAERQALARRSSAPRAAAGGTAKKRASRPAGKALRHH